MAAALSGVRKRAGGSGEGHAAAAAAPAAAPAITAAGAAAPSQGQAPRTSSGTQARGARRGHGAAARAWRRRAALAALAAAMLLLATANLLAPQLLARLLPRLAAARSARLPTPGPIVHLNLSQPPDADGGRPALGIFPRGCKWRDVEPPPPPGAPDGGGQGDSSSGGGAAAARVTYEYWDEGERHWAPRQPAACRLQDSPAPGPPPPWRLHKGSPRTEVFPARHHVTYRNLWYNAGRWYALVDGGREVAPWRFSKNQEVAALHVRDARAWARSVRWRVVPGDTLVFDYVFFVHPTAIGHWWEMMGPLYSVLSALQREQQRDSGGGGAAAEAAAEVAAAPDAGFRRPCDQVVLLHLKRTHLMEWVRAVLAVALGVGGRGAVLPPILLQEETDVPWQQLAMPLEGVPPDEWVMFDRALITRDLFTGGNRSFAGQEDARRFRAEVYAAYGLPPPALRRPLPRVITFQRKVANRRVANEAALLRLLSRYGEVRVVQFDAGSSFADQLAAVAATTVFVSVHTSNLANAVLLQPGSAVIEIIQRHWTWNRMDQTFRDHTAQLGDVHHYAWRANRANETVYQSARDEARFSNWTKSECLAEECTEAHTRVDVAVDLEAFGALLDDVLPGVFAGLPVAQAARPWPEAL